MKTTLRLEKLVRAFPGRFEDWRELEPNETMTQEEIGDVHKYCVRKRPLGPWTFFKVYEEDGTQIGYLSPDTNHAGKIGYHFVDVESKLTASYMVEFNGEITNPFSLVNNFCKSLNPELFVSKCLLVGSAVSEGVDGASRPDDMTGTTAKSLIHGRNLTDLDMQKLERQGVLTAMGDYNDLKNNKVVELVNHAGEKVISMSFFDQLGRTADMIFSVESHENLSTVQVLCFAAGHLALGEACSQLKWAHFYNFAWKTGWILLYSIFLILFGMLVGHSFSYATLVTGDTFYKDLFTTEMVVGTVILFTALALLTASNLSGETTVNF